MMMGRSEDRRRNRVKKTETRKKRKRERKTRKKTRREKFALVLLPICPVTPVSGITILVSISPSFNKGGVVSAIRFEWR